MGISLSDCFLYLGLIMGGIRAPIFLTVICIKPYENENQPYF